MAYARTIIGLIATLFYLQNAIGYDALASGYLGSREGDPSSLVENVSTIHGDYTEIEVDLTVTAPDSLILSRFYSSRDTLQTATLGGWRFNPHCFLSIRKDPKGKSYSTAEGKFERSFVYVGNSNGTILTYVGWQNVSNPSQSALFKIDPEGESLGLVNTARGNIGCWTNLKNNELYYNPQTDSFELLLCSEGKRFYAKHPSLDIYFITHEILPSGNKIFYEFDEKGQLALIKETNSSEKKVLGWIKLSHGNGIHIETSDGKTADYLFEPDASGAQLLTEVKRSDMPNLHYQYQVIDNRALLLRKTLPEGRFVQVDYYTDKANQYKVRSVTTPSDRSEMANVQFSYGDDYTEVDGPGNRKTAYRFNEDFQLTSIEQYLDGSLYRVHKKVWGAKSDAGNLISTSVEDADGNTFYYKHFTYDSKNKGNIVEEREYGDVIGIGSIPLNIDEDGLVTNQDGHIKNYSYFSAKNTHGFFQTDTKGTGVKYWYKKGTNLLLKKFILTKGSPDSEDEDYTSGIRERHFYDYNEDAALTQVIVDDGREASLKDDHGVTERSITNISPRQELPNIGAPEIVEQKYGKSEILLKKTVNQFDDQGNVISQTTYDANDHPSYTVKKGYVDGLLVFETDPLGNATHYTYDGNHNLTSETRSESGISIEYGYDLKNRLIYTQQTDRAENQFKTHVAYDIAGNKVSEVDQFGNETIYINDSLGRPIQITYPEVSDGPHSSLRLTYNYAYDLFDNPISVTDHKGRTLTRSYNVHGKPVEINHLDGTSEVFRYDSGGNLHHYYGTDGLLQVFSYDYKGRLKKLEHFKRGSKSSNYPFKEKTYGYDAFHKTFETDERGQQTNYTYGNSGRLATLSKEDQEVEFVYDSLGRTHGVKKWKSSKTFTLEVKEYDLLDRVIEERTEDHNGQILTKKRYVYNDAGQVAQVIGYPQNKESILLKYEYDGFGRLSKATNAAGFSSTITYNDAYINEWGQKTRKRTLIDPLGNQTEETFDMRDNLIKVSKKDKSGQLLSESESSYDSSGNRILEKVLVLSSDETSRSYQTEWSFNQGDQLESFTLGKGTLEERTVSFEYNAYGDISAKYNHGSKEPISYRYDNEGNLDTISYKEGKKEINYKLFYDRRKNITEVYLDSSFTVTYSFNAQDMPLTETIEDEFGSYQVGISYDGEGKIKTLKLPDGSFVEYSYEGPFVKSARRFSKEKKELYTYQVASRDQMGHILEEILPGNLGSRKQLWDQSGRRVEISTDFFQDRVLAGGYDPLENIKKRETILDDETYSTNYDYNALSQIISEKGEIERKYSYDSIGNRLQKDGSIYKVNGVNQLIEGEGANYTFDLNGNLATKTVGGRTWTYQSNPLNQIVSIKDPDQNTVKFTYDPSGKRLTKRIEAKGKKAKVFRFFYLGETEIGSVDEKGVITELKVPSDPNNPEAPSIAIEVRKEIHVPLYDLQGNVVCILDHQRRKVVETYRYSVYGEEEIINNRGRLVSDSSVGNPWRYRGKRVDKEIDLIYFGYRYYNPEVGRWITPDPAGYIDGPNLYAYVRSNPMAYVDYFGLSSEIDDGCGCTQHGHPGWYYAPLDCVCICGRNGIGAAEGSYRSKVGSDIMSAMTGISHGVVDYVIGSIHDLQTGHLYDTAADLEISLKQRHQMIEAVEQSQADQLNDVGSGLMGMFGISESDSMYQSFRSTTTLGLEIGSLVAGGYGAVKGVMAFNKLAKVPYQATGLVKSVKKAESLINRGTSFAGSKHAPLDYAPYQRIRNESTLINGRKYTGHALDRMQDRGFMPSVIENTINTGRVSPADFPGGLEYYDPVNKIRAIVGENGQIITIIPGRG